jgi:hypothetical protein
LISPLYISSESYLVQIYYEAGILGLGTFIFVYFKAIKNLYEDQSRRYLSYILIAFITNMMASPAFYGFSTSLFVYPIIVYGILKTNSK